MQLMRLPSEGWVLVCDGARAQILRNAGDAVTPHLVEVEISEQHLPAAHDMGSERPGRVHQSQGASRSSNEILDLHAAGEAAFIAATVARLDVLAREHAVKSLIVVAPPKVLGLLRGELTLALRLILTNELGRDLAHFSAGDIEKHLAA
jgi:protein required for attachment to host cells